MKPVDVISDLNGEEIDVTFFEKELQKTNQEKFRIEEVIKRKGNKQYVKWKVYDDSFNTWIDKRDIEFPRIKISQYSPKQLRIVGGNFNVNKIM